MKKLKIMLASVAFLFALVTAFASKNVSSTDTLDQYYIQNGTNCVTTNCSPNNIGDVCDFTVYKEDLAHPCSTAVVGTTRRPI